MVLSRLPFPSLRQMAMLKIAITVCNDPDIRDFLKEHGSVSFVFPTKETQVFLEKAGRQFEQNSELDPEKTWAWKDYFFDGRPADYGDYMYGNIENFDECEMREAILPFGRWEELVNKKASLFLLPPLLRSELLDVIRSIAAEIDKWIKDHFLILGNSSVKGQHAHYYFQWNSIGKIDRVKTAGALIMNARLHINEICILAFYYGLVDLIFWSQNRHLSFGEFPERHLGLTGWGRCPKAVWKSLTGENDLNYISQRIFFTNSTNEQKVKCLNNVMFTEFMQYGDFLNCLSQMGDDKKEFFLKKHPLKILMYFLDWPLQSEFIEAAKRLLPYFTIFQYRYILSLILYEKIMLGRKDFNYISLLKEFWTISPSGLKQLVEKDSSIYKNIMYILNYPSDEIFPNEQLFESYHDNVLSFGYMGMKYFLIRTKTFSNKHLRTIFKSLDPMTLVPHLHLTFGHIFFICSVRRKPQEQGLTSQIKLKVTDFISKFRSQKQ